MVSTLEKTAYKDTIKDFTIVAVSGGFDPIHKGHIRYIREAKKLGDYLVILLNSNNQLIRKKGYYFQTFEERKEILESIKGVDEVVEDPDTEITCEKALELVEPHVFAKGGDRTSDTMAKIEVETCKRLGIRIVYGVGGDKSQSSSWLIYRMQQKKKSNNLKDVEG